MHIQYLDGKNMKTKVLLLISIGIMITNIINCKYNRQIYPEDQILNSLKQFYTNYIIEIDKMPLDEVKIKKLKEQYCTSKFITKLEEQDLDFDPFLNAQDCNIEWLKTLSIKKDTIKTNQYLVSYKDIYSNSQITIDIFIAKDNNAYKIDSIAY
jgi:hypothetical protein